MPPIVARVRVVRPFQVLRFTFFVLRFERHHVLNRLSAADDAPAAGTYEQLNIFSRSNRNTGLFAVGAATAAPTSRALLGAGR